MCGIAVLVNKNNSKINETELAQCRDIISHRGPDHAGLWINGNTGFAHRRLSILDLTGKGNQPFHYQHLTIVFNGEIYNFIELKKELIKKGYSFQSETDTEVILASYLSWGHLCVDYFNGIWAFVIHDSKNKTLFCSRDRFGIKPLLYTSTGEKFCLASEIKQFTLIRGWNAKLNKSICFDWLLYDQKNHNAETFFTGVHQLAAGTNLLYDLKTHEYSIRPYYDIEQVVYSKKKEHLSFEIATEKFRHLFENAIKLQMRSDAKVGTSLSGGLDSTSIASTISKIGKTETLSFSYAPKEKEYSEKKYIDIATKEANLLNISVSPPFDHMLQAVDKVTWHQEEPLSALNVIANYFVFKKAKEKGIKVLLNGQGADEILGGYDACFKPFWNSLLKRNPLNLVFELGGFAYHHKLSNFGISKKILNKPLNNKNGWPNKVLLNNAKKTNELPAQNLLDYQLQSIKKNVLPKLLHYEDRNGMANSVEARVPFLDHRLVEFCLLLPDHFKINRGRRKWLLRKALKDRLPKPIYHRYDKLAFATPQQEWLKSNKRHLLKINTERLYDMGIIEPNINTRPLLQDMEGSYRWKLFALDMFFQCYF